VGALVICTEWQNFKAPSFDLIKEESSESYLFDGRNLFEFERMKTSGFSYCWIDLLVDWMFFYVK